MSDKFGGVPIDLELTALEMNALVKTAERDKRGIKEQIRWLIEEYWRGNLTHHDDGTRPILHSGSTQHHYPDDIRVKSRRVPPGA